MDEPTPLQQHRPTTPKIPAEPVPPIQSRFLFVDVAACAPSSCAAARGRASARKCRLPHKAERVAMEEVRRGLVYYDVPPAETGGREEAEG